VLRFYLDWSYRFVYIIEYICFFMNNVMVSLGDSRMKDIAEVLGSKSCVKILDLLAVENLAVSDISRKLGMKINTTDYNVKKLVRAGLIEKSDYWWSVKGKKMPVYRVSDKSIVISPRRKVAKKFLWILGLTGIAGIWIRSLMGGVHSGSEYVMSAPKAEAVFSRVAEANVADAASEMGRYGLVSDVGSGFWAGLAGWEWFLLGAWGTIVLFFVYSLIVEKRA
jgi:DNA-binding transcriptional ArsR family regulator